MYINPSWRILTVGDGDLTFSYALSQQFPNIKLVASVLDSEAVLRNKYEHHAIDLLLAQNTPVHFEFDATNQSCWERLNTQFDVVIFQFPLIPSFTTKAAFEASPYSVNTLNRILLRTFINFTQTIALDPKGPMLSYITSKDVKPYREWNIEGSLVQGLPYHYLGYTRFNIDAFPGYRVRNVDRDKHVKDTSGLTYVWSTKSSMADNQTLAQPIYLQEGYCTMCRAGAFQSEADKAGHERSRMHKAMSEAERDWQTYLNHN